LPAERHCIYAYILFLEAEGAVALTSVPQYLSALSTYHRWRGFGSFIAADWITARMISAWKHRAPATVYRDQVRAFPASAIEEILHRVHGGLAPSLLRALTAVCIDFVFFSRADSCFDARVEDISILNSAISFRERRRKGQQLQAMDYRVRRFDGRGCPLLLSLVSGWIVASARLRRPPAHPDAPAPSASFWGLPGEPRPSAAAVQAWFRQAMVWLARPDLDGLHHHSLRKGGASSAFSLGVPVWRLADWGAWSLKSDAIHRYIDMSHSPGHADFRFFGWMQQEPARLQAELGHIFE
jgi:hypothetical protein